MQAKIIPEKINTADISEFVISVQNMNFNSGLTMIITKTY